MRQKRSVKNCKASSTVQSKEGLKVHHMTHHSLILDSPRIQMKTCMDAKDWIGLGYILKRLNELMVEPGRNSKWTVFIVALYMKHTEVI